MHSNEQTETLSVTFASLALSEPLQRALAEKNYTDPSPIQAQAIPSLLEGRDLIGVAQTGTGKTAAFALPILQRLNDSHRPHTPKGMRALILTPTRELAAQIQESFRTYGKHLKLTSAVIFGGVNQNPQVAKLSRGIDILVATPGRLLDLCQQGHVSLNQVEVFVLDEADRMLDMGFIHDVKRIMAMLPTQRQSLLFSATMPEEIQKLADSLVHNPVRVEVTPVATTAERIDQYLCHVERANKMALLVHTLKQHPEGLVLVFVEMKHVANRVAEQLTRNGLRADAIHGNKSQNARERALDAFKTGRARILVATDIAARGIDVKGISLVINYDIPDEPESYVHRIGRTARAGADGKAISFCDANERPQVRAIERVIRQDIPLINDHPYVQVVSEETNDVPHYRRMRLGGRRGPGGPRGAGRARGGSSRSGGGDRSFGRDSRRSERSSESSERSHSRPHRSGSRSRHRNDDSRGAHPASRENSHRTPTNGDYRPSSSRARGSHPRKDGARSSQEAKPKRRGFLSLFLRG